MGCFCKVLMGMELGSTITKELLKIKELAVFGVDCGGALLYGELRWVEQRRKAGERKTVGLR